MNTKENISTSEMINEAFTLTAYFRTLLRQKNSEKVFNFLLKEGWLTKEQMEKRWDSFDNVFWEENKDKISALVFSSIIEWRWYLLDSLIKEKSDKNTCVIEVASWFSPRALNLVNDNWFQFLDYIEADRQQVIDLKTKFYTDLKNVKTPWLSWFNVVDDSMENLEKSIIDLKSKNQNLDKILLFNEWLLIYLTPEEQKVYFDKIRDFSKKMKNKWIELEFLSIDVATIENFIDALTFDWFNHNDHEKVNKKVDPEMWDRLQDTEKEFFDNINIDSNDIEKYFYDEKVFSQMKLSEIEKYKTIPNIKDEIRKFLSKDSLYAYSIKL